MRRSESKEVQTGEATEDTENPFRFAPSVLLALATKTVDDDDWKGHPDRSDQSQLLRPIVTQIEGEVT